MRNSIDQNLLALLNYGLNLPLVRAELHSEHESRDHVNLQLEIQNTLRIWHAQFLHTDPIQLELTQWHKLLHSLHGLTLDFSDKHLDLFGIYPVMGAHLLHSKFHLIAHKESDNTNELQEDLTQDLFNPQKQTVLMPLLHAVCKRLNAYGNGEWNIQQDSAMRLQRFLEQRLKSTITNKSANGLKALIQEVLLTLNNYADSESFDLLWCRRMLLKALLPHETLMNKLEKIHMQITLTAEELSTLHAAAHSSFEKFSFSASCHSAQDIVKRINTSFFDYDETNNRYLFKADEADVTGLSLLLGEQYVREFGWQWWRVSFMHQPTQFAYVVLDTKHNRGIVPFQWMLDMIQKQIEPNFLLNFNMEKEASADNADLTCLRGIKFCH